MVGQQISSFGSWTSPNAYDEARDTLSGSCPIASLLNWTGSECAVALFVGIAFGMDQRDGASEDNPFSDARCHCHGPLAKWRPALAGSAQ